MTKGMYFDPNSSTFLSSIEKLPEFKNYNHPKRENIFKYIALMYDINTPLINEIGDYYQRKKYCADLCEFPVIEDVYEQEFEDIILMKNKTVNILIVIFIASFASADYMQLIFSWESMIQIMINVSNVTTDKQTVETMRKLNDDINKNTNIIFRSGNYTESIEIRKLLYATAELKRLKHRPETIARKLFEGEDLNEFCPYGKYIVDKMRFINDTEPDIKNV